MLNNIFHKINGIYHLSNINKNDYLIILFIFVFQKFKWLDLILYQMIRINILII